MVSFLKNHWEKIILAVFISIYVVTFSTLTILRHNAFASGLDLGNMDQTVWNTLHGRFFTLTEKSQTVSRFAVHSDIMLVFFAPFYLLWASPHLLNIIQSLLLGLGAIPVFLIARHILRSKGLSLLFVFMYLLSPLTQWINIFDFHTVSFSIPLILAAFYCVLKDKWKWYWFFILLALLTKEEISLQVAVLGLIVFFVFKKKREGLITFFSGILWFAAMIFLVIPYFSSQGQHWAFAWFQLGSSGLRQSFQTKLSFIVNRLLFVPEIRTYYSLLLKSSGLLPIFGLPWLALALPELMINILSSHSEMYSIRYHYTSGLIPGLIIASIYAASYLSNIFKKIPIIQKYQKQCIFLIILGGLLVVLRTNYHYSPLPTTESCWCISYQVTDEDRKFEEILKNIPSSASVTASTEIHAHVTHRENSYIFPYATDSADFIALIDQNRIIDNYGPKPYELELMKKLNKDRVYELQNHIGHFYLYKKH